MAVPKKKVSKSKRNMRRSHHALNWPRSIKCSSCGELKLAHHICSYCGTYRKQKIRHIAT